MRIYKCESCRYVFMHPLLPSSCPDCGKQSIRIATENERQDFHRNQKILAEEIRLGIYAVSG